MNPRKQENTPSVRSIRDCLSDVFLVNIIFGNDTLGPQSLGYDNKKEVLIRLARIYPPEACEVLNAVAFFIKPLREPIFNARPEIERE